MAGHEWEAGALAVTPRQLNDALPVGAWLAVDALATWRITSLLLSDSLPPLPRLRDAWRRRWGDRAPAELAECPRCLSVWVAAAVLTARLTAPAAWSPVSLVCAWSVVAYAGMARE